MGPTQNEVQQKVINHIEIHALGIYMHLESTPTRKYKNMYKGIHAHRRHTRVQFYASNLLPYSIHNLTSPWKKLEIGEAKSMAY